MTRFIRPSDGQKVIKWDRGDPVDWTTPETLRAPCPCLPSVQKRGDDPLPYEYRGPIP